jgi:site-specific recombinase XerD
MVPLLSRGQRKVKRAHDLRRTAAALALKWGAALRQIQQMLGHASITTTEKYLEPMRSLQVTAGAGKSHSGQVSRFKPFRRITC